MPKQCNIARNAAIVALYQQGWTLQAIGDQYGVTRERVRQILAQHGVTAAESVAKRPPKLPPWFFEAWRRRDRGETVRDIARALGHHEHYVRKMLQRGGVPSRRTNRPGQPWRCITCKRGEAEGARFSPHQGNHSGLSSQCRECNTAQVNDYYRRNADTIEAKARAKRAAQREQPVAAD